MNSTSIHHWRAHIINFKCFEYLQLIYFKLLRYSNNILCKLFKFPLAMVWPWMCLFKAEMCWVITSTSLNHHYHYKILCSWWQFDTYPKVKSIFAIMTFIKLCLLVEFYFQSFVTHLQATTSVIFANYKPSMSSTW